MTETKEKRNIFFEIWKSCPVRNALAVLGLAFTALYFILRENYSLMCAVSEGFVKPYHRLMGRITSVIPFSVAELIYALAVVLGIWYTVRSVCRFIRGGDRLKTLYRYIMTAISVALCFYGGFCLLWGVYYYSFDFESASNMQERPISTEELRIVTEYFAELSNEYAVQVPRENGLYTADTDDVLDRAKYIYTAVESEYPFLDGYEIRPKAMVFSELMSHINFTGFFFPFTGEANLNIHEPICLLLSTCAHEIAHQRGIAAEDEANFAAVLACLECDDVEFKYSGALLGYIHVGNALYYAEPETYLSISATLNQAVRADLDANNAYWAQYETKAAEVSEAVYTEFLQSHGQELGMKSYGACVDLLVAHYLEDALTCGLSS